MIDGGNVIGDDEAAFLESFAPSSAQHAPLARGAKGPDPDPTFGDVLAAFGGPFAAVPYAAELEPSALPLDPYAPLSSRKPLGAPAKTAGIPTWALAAGVALAAAGVAIYVMGQRR